MSGRFLALLSAFATALALFAAPAMADNSPRAGCVFVRQIYSFKEIDDYSAIIQTSPSRRYKVTFYNSCRELRWAIFARVEARPGICLSRGDKIVVGRHGFRERCYIKSIEPLPPRNRTTDASY
jgi:hypothetical protein